MSRRSFFLLSFLLFSLTAALFAQPGLKSKQMAFPKVKQAFDKKQTLMTRMLEMKGIRMADMQMMLIAYKQDSSLELWARNKQDTRYQLIQYYPFCGSSGILGPKRSNKDKQIPEGFYSVSRLVPDSTYLALQINFPNESDKILAYEPLSACPVFILGGCLSSGNLSVSDERMEELFLMAVEALTNGQQKIPVWIFPATLDEWSLQILREQYHFPALMDLWADMSHMYTFFKVFGYPPTILTDKTGRYLMKDSDREKLP